MLRFLVIPVLLFSSLLSATDAQAADPWERKAPFKNAVITYEVSGTSHGEETLYLRDWGRERVRVVKSSAKILFVTQETNTITITTPQNVTEIDLDEKSGKRMVNPTVYLKAEYEKLSEKEKKQVMDNARKMGTSMGGQYQPNAEKINGYLCDRTTIMGSSVWNIHMSSIMLKSESSIMGITTNIKVVSLKTVSPPSSLFSPPADVTIVPATAEEEEESKNVAKMTIDWLKDPDSAKRMESLKEQSLHEEERGENDESSDSGADGENGSMGDALQKGADALKDLW